MALSSIANKNYSLSPYITEPLKTTSDTLRNQAGWSKTAAKICTAAFLAIGAAAFAISLGIAVPIPSALLIPCAISAIPLQFSSAYFYKHAHDCTRLAQIAEDQEACIEQIKHWTSREVKDFLQLHQISESELPLEELAKMRPNDPLCALLPAIAKYHYWQGQAKAFLLRYKANIENTAQDPILKTIGRSQAWSILENKAMPAALQAAFMLRIIKQPSLQMQWEQLGRCQSKTFEQRVFDRWLDRSDDYFVFNEPGRPAITLKELCRLLKPLNIDAIHQALTQSDG